MKLYAFLRVLFSNTTKSLWVHDLSVLLFEQKTDIPPFQDEVLFIPQLSITY